MKRRITFRDRGLASTWSEKLSDQIWFSTCYFLKMYCTELHFRLMINCCNFAPRMVKQKLLSFLRGSKLGSFSPEEVSRLVTPCMETIGPWMTTTTDPMKTSVHAQGFTYSSHSNKNLSLLFPTIVAKSPSKWNSFVTRLGLLVVVAFVVSVAQRHNF